MLLDLLSSPHLVRVRSVVLSFGGNLGENRVLLTPAGAGGALAWQLTV